jgi:hypothetical protein
VLPATHQRDQLIENLPVSQEDESWEFWEDLKHWRRYAECAAAVLRLREDLARGEPGDAALWQAAYGRVPTCQDNPQRCLTGALNNWLRMGRPLMLAIPGANRPTLRFVNGWAWSQQNIDVRDDCYQMSWAGDLFSKLTAALALEITGGGWVRCRGCGIYFDARGDSRRRYCDTCGRRGQVRDAVRRYRGKRRS